MRVGGFLIYCGIWGKNVKENGGHDDKRNKKKKERDGGG
jgi:hypothetical protein